MAKPVPIPKSLTILGKPFSVVMVDNLDDGANAGEMLLGKQQITLATGQHFENERDTLLHETLHAIDEQLNLRIREKQIHQLAVALLQVLRENPKLVKYIVAPRPTAVVEPNLAGDPAI